MDFVLSNKKSHFQSILVLINYSTTSNQLIFLRYNGKKNYSIIIPCQVYFNCCKKNYSSSIDWYNMSIRLLERFFNVEKTIYIFFERWFKKRRRLSMWSRTRLLILLNWFNLLPLILLFFSESFSCSFYFCWRWELRYNEQTRTHKCQMWMELEDENEHRIIIVAGRWRTILHCSRIYSCSNKFQIVLTFRC